MGAFSLPISGPAAQNPDTLRNPILEEIDRAAKDAHAQLSPQAQEALRRAGAPIPGASAPSPPVPIRGPQTAPPPISMSAPELGTPAASRPILSNPASLNIAPPATDIGAQQPILPMPPPGRISMAPPPTPLETAQQRERDQAAQGTFPGIHNKFLRGLATTGDIVAGTFSPRLEQLIPGSMGNQELKRGRAKEQVAAEETALNQPVERGLKTAQTAEQASLPAFHAATAEIKRLQEEENQIRDQNAQQLGAAKNDTERAKIEAQQAAATAARRATAAEHGYTIDENGKTAPMAYEEMSPQAQSISDLKASQAEQASANAALNQARASAQPQMIALQQKRLDEAMEMQKIALQKLGNTQGTYNARYLGLDKNGNPLPGAPLTDQGQPVGSVNGRFVAPTGTERQRADLARSATEQLEDMKAIVQKRADIFGPAAGRKTDFTQWLGSEDPDAKRFATARTILGDHSAGAFGGRSDQTVRSLESAAGLFKDNPEAILAGLGQFEKANKQFLKAGTPRTQGSNAAAAEPVVPPAPAPAVEEWVRDPKTKKLVKK